MQEIRISDYSYELPEDRIAKHPLAQRDASRLLVYAHGEIRHRRFFQLPEALPPGSQLVFNDTRVIRARLEFRRASGARIEIFLLHPIDPPDLERAMQASGSALWACIIGNRKRWKPGEVLERHADTPGGPVRIEALLEGPAPDAVRLRWTPAGLLLPEVLDRIGQVPLPPYLGREAEEPDTEAYQTVYARHPGAVAAPTAGLHFTEPLLAQLDAAGTVRTTVTLHVSAGTFLPVKHDDARQHEMHAEHLAVGRESLAALLQHGGPRIAVGTTALRTLESLYWLGVRALREPLQPDADGLLHLGQWEAYAEQPQPLPSREAALQALAGWLSGQAADTLRADTQLMIMPGYQIRMADGLITNFHQPGSTLLLLIAALIGDRWRQVYQEALDTGYRFLSYGDSSLLLP